MFPPHGAITRFVLIIAFLILPAFVIALYTHLRYGMLFMLGCVLGLALLIGHIGFTTAWRKAILRQDARPLGHQFVLLCLASIASLAVLAALPDAVPNKAPVSLSLVVGSFLFGLGMQFGKGCGSGTAVHAGEGSEHSLLTLVFFIVGSLLGSWHLPTWLDFAAADPVYFPELVDWRLIALAYLLIFAALLFALGKSSGLGVGALLWQTRRLIGALALIGAAMLVLVFSGSMWSVTFAYTIWGAKLATLVGLDLSGWAFWQWELPAAALRNSVLTNVPSLTTLGMMAGVFVYALFHGSFGGKARINGRQVAGALFGGLLMGYGARLSFGCNIGALFSGLASGSLHGWIWYACAYAGSWVALTRFPGWCDLKQLEAAGATRGEKV